MPTDLHRWKDLFRLTAIFYIILTLIPAVAVVLFFVWPYAPGSLSTAEVFDLIQTNLFGAMMALDLSVLLGAVLTLFPLLSMYIALRHVNDSYALIGLAIGMIGVAALVAARPVVEVVILSNQYAAAATDAERALYLAAGEALLPTFHGAAWYVGSGAMGVSFLIFALMMLRSPIFSRTLAWVGIVTNVALALFFLPMIGPLLMFIGTITGVVWSVQLAWRFYQLSRDGDPAPATAPRTAPAR